MKSNNINESIRKILKGRGVTVNNNQIYKSLLNAMRCLANNSCEIYYKLVYFAVCDVLDKDDLICGETFELTDDEKELILNLFKITTF